MGIVRNGDNYFLLNSENIQEKLEPNVYVVNFHPEKGYYLTLKENFKLPKKIYGDHTVVDRWIKSYENNSEKNMGIILSGLKGTGKTITAQIFCQKMNVPVIMINEEWHGPSFVDFITNPQWGKAIIFIDEFEKVYNTQRSEDKSEDLLSVMDGNYPTKLIFLLTVNEFRINEYLINRLNRIKYRKDYQNLEQKVIDEVIDDLLINKNYKESIHNFFDVLGMCTFDILVNLIKEINLFNEDALECGKYLNLKAEATYYEISEIVGENRYECESANLYLSDIDTEIEIERSYKNPNRISPKKVAITEESDDDNEDEYEDDGGLESNITYVYGWSVSIRLADCIVEKKNKEYLVTTKGGMKFHFRPMNKYKMVF